MTRTRVGTNWIASLTHLNLASTIMLFSPAGTLWRARTSPAGALQCRRAHRILRQSPRSVHAPAGVHRQQPGVVAAASAAGTESEAAENEDVPELVPAEAQRGPGFKQLGVDALLLVRIALHGPRSSGMRCRRDPPACCIPSSSLRPGQPARRATDTSTVRALQPGLSRMGIDAPAPVQLAAIPAILQGANCAVQSYTGSGKVGRQSRCPRRDGQRLARMLR